MSWFSRRPVSDLLAEASIPSPSGVMTDMLVLRIAELPTVIDKSTLDSDMMWLDLPVAGDRKIEVRLSRSGAGYVGLDGCYQYHKEKLEVKVGMPGPPVYRSVDLSSRERWRLIQALMTYRFRCAAQRAADRDAESQRNALELLERLI